MKLATLALATMILPSSTITHITYPFPQCQPSPDPTKQCNCLVGRQPMPPCAR